MTSLVEDLLLLARLDAGRPLERAGVDLSRLVLDVVGDAQIAGPGHQWKIQLPAEPVVITGDVQRLHQVLGNLLSNAARTPAGHGRHHRAVRPQRTGGPDRRGQWPWHSARSGGLRAVRSRGQLAVPCRGQHRPRAVDRGRGGGRARRRGVRGEHARTHDFHGFAAHRSLTARAHDRPRVSGDSRLHETRTPGAGRAADRDRRALPVAAGGLRLGQRLLLRRRPGRRDELEGLVLRLHRRVERDHRRQDARLGVGDGPVGTAVRRERVEHPGAAGVDGRRQRVACCTRRSAAGSPPPPR